MLQQGADSLPNCRSARFANNDRRDPRTGKIFDQQPNLGRLAASLGSFETDEETCLTRVRHARIVIVDERDCRKKEKKFVREGEDKAKPLFEKAFAEHDVLFVNRLKEVPDDTEILSVFITEKIDDAFLDDHHLIRLIATRSTGCDHIDLDVCERRGVGIANVGNYG